MHPFPSIEANKEKSSANHQLNFLKNLAFKKYKIILNNLKKKTK
jgi:hypothetical protein